MNSLFELSKSLIDQGLITPTNPKKPLPKLEKKIGLKELQSFSIMHEGKKKTLDEIPISYSWLKEFYSGLKYEAPYKFIEYRVNERDKKYNSLFSIGNVVESLLCGGVEYTETNVYVVNCEKISSKHIEQAKNLGKDFIKLSDWQRCCEMRYAAMKNKEFNDIINNTRIEFQTKERSAWDEETGLHFSGILDIELDGVITDIKTTERLSDFPNLFTNTMHYWIQAVIHRKIFGAKDFQFFVIQRKKPYLSTFYRISPEKWNEFELKFWNNLIVPYYDCLENGFFPRSYSPDTRWL